MNNDQQLLSWLAVFGIIIGVWLVYKQQLSAIIFGTAQSGGWQNTGPGTANPQSPFGWGNNNPGGLAPAAPASPAPAAAPTPSYAGLGAQQGVTL